MALKVKALPNQIEKLGLTKLKRVLKDRFKCRQYTIMFMILLMHWIQSIEKKNFQISHFA